MNWESVIVAVVTAGPPTVAAVAAWRESAKTRKAAIEAAEVAREAAQFAKLAAKVAAELKRRKAAK